MLCSRLVGQYETPTADCGLRSADHGLGIKNGLGIKQGLRTEYKTQTMHYVYKNSFRKVKLRETECDWHKTVLPAPCLTHKTLPLAGHAVYSPQSQRNAEKESILHGQGRLCLYSSQLKKKIWILWKKRRSCKQSPRSSFQSAGADLACEGGRNGFFRRLGPIQWFTWCRLNIF